MTVYFAKSLDRPIDIFGIKGKWLTIFLVAAGCSVVFSLIVGFSVSAGAGIATAILLVVVSFIVCMVMQGKISHRQVAKVKASSFICPFISRKETIGRILLPDPMKNKQNSK